jgi:N-acetylmuramoyl-L-alanine amidase/putative methionine-R-sulfoxide reductase with GAF domain
MATTTSKPDIDISDALTADAVPAWPTESAASGSDRPPHKASQRDALQALLAFSALHDQIRRRKALASRHGGFDSPVAVSEFEPGELFVLDEVLQLVAERAVTITGADGLAIALAENNEIVLRAAAGAICPDPGTRIDRDSAFSGACFRTAQIVICDDTETDPRVNLQSCRKLGARSMVAVPLCGRRRVIGVLEAFSSWPFAFNEIDVRNLSLLAELVLAALKPEDEDRFAQSAQVAATKLETPKPQPPKIDPLKPVDSIKVEAPKPVAPKLEPPKVELPKPAITAAPIIHAPVLKPTIPPKPASIPVAAATPATTPVAPPFKPVVPEPPRAATTPAVPVAAVPAAVAPAPAIPAPKPIPPAPAAIKPVETAVVPSKPAVPVASAPKPVETKVTPSVPASIPVPTATKAVPPTTPRAPATTVTAQAASAPPAVAPTAPPAKPQDEPKVVTAPEVATATAPEPTLTFGQPAAEESNRPWLLVMLIGTVIAAAFIAGVWWKLKNAQIGGAMVQNPPQIEKPVTPVQPKAAQPAAATDSNPTNDALSADNEPENTPATPQELSKFPRVTAVRHWSSGDSSTVVLDLEDQVQYEPGHLANPERFYFDLRDTQLAHELEGKSFDGDTLLSRIRIAQPVSGMTRVVLEARPSATLSAPQVSLERDPYRLVIQVSKAGATPKGAVNLFPTAPETEKAKLAIVVPPPTKEDLQLRTRVNKMRIVVDAGHGGWDLGTVGRRGLLEKDLVLEIAQRLGKLLETRLGAEVIYTRQDDNYIPLDDRAVVANQAQANLFVSVHANYSDLPSARGVETYYTNFFSAPGSKDLPANATPREVAMRSMPKNIATPTLTPAELHDRIEQSRRLATSVQRSLYGTLSILNPGLRDRGIKEAGFVVLTESAMPGILAEVSFVSSPTDEQKLRSDMYREQIAEALYHGIARYAASDKGAKVASAAK